MKAIYKKEVKGYLTSMAGYLFVAFLLMLFGLYFTAINLQQGYPEIGFALESSGFAFLIAVPVLTMRVLSEERKNKTDQLLLTAPVKISDIILGKYFALLSIFAVPVVLICFYPLLLSVHGTVSFSMAYTAILGYFLLGAAYLSIGVFISSITESQVIAAVVCFAVLFVCYVESGIASFFPEGAASSFFSFFVIAALVCLWIGSMMKNVVITGILMVLSEGTLTAFYFWKSSLFEGKIQDFLGIFNVAEHLENFTNGILDLNGVVYFLSVIVICMFLAIQSLQKRRWN